MKEVFGLVLFLFSAADGRRPRNYLSCCCTCWIFRLVYALSTPTTVLPVFFILFVLVVIEPSRKVSHDTKLAGID